MMDVISNNILCTKQPLISFNVSKRRPRLLLCGAQDIRPSGLRRPTPTNGFYGEAGGIHDRFLIKQEQTLFKDLRRHGH